MITEILKAEGKGKVRSAELGVDTELLRTLHPAPYALQTEQGTLNWLVEWWTWHSCISI